MFVGDQRLLPLDVGWSVLSDVPQVTICGLDASSVMDCYPHVSDWDSSTRAAYSERWFVGGLKNLSGTRRRVYAFSERFCRLLAGLSDEQAPLIARNWYAPEESSPLMQAEAEVKARTDTLLALSRLAQTAIGGHATLFLMVRYRSRLTDA